MTVAPLAPPAVQAWCRFVGPDGGARLGAIDPATGRFHDLGPLDVVALLAKGALRAADGRSYLASLRLPNAQLDRIMAAVRASGGAREAAAAGAAARAAVAAPAGAP